MQFLTNTDRDIDLPVSNSSLTYPKLGIFFLSFLVLEISFFQKIRLEKYLACVPGGTPHTRKGVGMLVENFEFIFLACDSKRDLHG